MLLEPLEVLVTCDLPLPPRRSRRVLAPTTMQSRRGLAGSSGGASPASSRAFSHWGNALGRGGGGFAGLVVVRALLEKATVRAAPSFFFFFSVNMGWSPSSSSSTFGFCRLGLDLLFGDLGLDGHGAAGPASGPGAEVGMAE